MLTFEWSEIFGLTEFLLTIIYWSVIVGVAGVCMLIFEAITPYSDRKELVKGNAAVGIQFAGKLVGLGIVAQSSIVHNLSVWGAAIWIFIGFALMVVAYYVFEWVTPFKVEREIANGNKAVAIVAAAVSIFVGFVVAGSIT